MHHQSEQINGEYRVVTFKTGLWKQNSYLVQHLPSKDILLIDPGSEAQKIVEAIERDEGNLKLVILTHAHHDHVAGLKTVCDKFVMPFYIHPQELKLLKRAPFYAMMFEKFEMEVPSDHRFLGEEKLEWQGDGIDFIHLPGHTTGGVAFTIANTIFTGDTLLNRQVGRTDLPGASIQLLKESITKLLEMVSEESYIFPGHGNPWRVKEAKQWWKEHNSKPPEYREMVQTK